MLIGLVGETAGGKSVLASYLVRNHQFVCRTTVPAKPLGRGQRVVIDPGTLRTTRHFSDFMRKVHRRGGIIVNIERTDVGNVPFITIPNPTNKPEVMCETMVRVLKMLGMKQR